jgi:hypothetical protein
MSRIFGTAVSALAFSILAVGHLQAAVLSFSTTTPTIGANDVSNLVGTTSAAANVNPDGGVYSYVAHDNVVQGQTFTTGSNPGGYILDSVTLQHVLYSTDVSYYDTTGANGFFNVRVTKPTSATALSVILSETAATVPADPNNIGQALPGPGTGKFVTFDLAGNPVLLPNTVYGFDVGGANVTFFESNGTNTNPYAGGVAYISGDAGTLPGVGDLTLTAGTGDHVFIAKLIPVPVPEPSSVLIMLSGAVGLLIAARRPSAN